jgi:hypothetical protein
VVEITLDPLVFEIAELAYPQADGYHFSDLIPLGMAEHNLENALGDGKFMHVLIFSPFLS